MSDYGYTKYGFRSPDYDALLARFYRHLESTLGIEIDREEDGPFGQLGEIATSFYLENWDFLQVFYNNSIAAGVWI